MKRFLAAAACLCLFVTSADALEIKGPDAVPAGAMVILQVDVEEGAKVKWVVVPKSANFAQFEDGRVAVFSGPARDWTFIAMTVREGVIDFGERTVTVGVVPPTPPNPNPVPTPPGPTPVPPVPGPAPLPSAELQTILAPVKAIMDQASDRRKVAVFKQVWSDFAAVSEVKGVSKTVVGFRNELGLFIAAAIRQAGLLNAFPGYTKAFNEAMNKAVGSQDGALDPVKGKEFINGLVWACGDTP